MNMDINGLYIYPVNNDECYKFLKVGENITYVGAVIQKRQKNISADLGMYGNQSNLPLFKLHSTNILHQILDCWTGHIKKSAAWTLEKAR